MSNNAQWMKATFWYATAYRASIREQGKLTITEVQNREHSYRAWWEEKNGMLWRDRIETAVESYVAPHSLLKEPETIPNGSRIRPVSASSWDKDHNIAHKGIERVHSYRTGAAPAIYVVSVNGKRIDSFLSKTNAKRCALALSN